MGALLAAGAFPSHVLHLNSNLATFYVLQGVLAPLDPFIQKDKDAKPADFVPKAWEMFTIKGKQYALPREGGPNALYYNKALVQAGGVQPPTDSWTFASEYRDAAVKLTRADSNVWGTHIVDWRVWVYSNGGDIVDTTTGEVLLEANTELTPEKLAKILQKMAA